MLRHHDWETSTRMVKITISSRGTWAFMLTAMSKVDFDKSAPKARIHCTNHMIIYTWILNGVNIWVCTYIHSVHLHVDRVSKMSLRHNVVVQVELSGFPMFFKWNFNLFSGKFQVEFPHFSTWNHISEKKQSTRAQVVKMSFKWNYHKFPLENYLRKIKDFSSSSGI